MTTYSSTEAAELAGISYRMLDYYVRQEVIVPTVASDGSGSRREWSQADVDALVAMGRVSEAMRVDGHTASAGMLRRVADAAREGKSQVELTKGVWLSWRDA